MRVYRKDRAIFIERNGQPKVELKYDPRIHSWYQSVIASENSIKSEPMDGLTDSALYTAITGQQPPRRF